MSALDELQSDIERANALVNLLIEHATGGRADVDDFVGLRSHFLDLVPYDRLLPTWLRSQRSLNQFWNFIKSKFPTYAERRTFLWEEFDPLLNALESSTYSLTEDDLGVVLADFDAEGVKRSWRRLTRRVVDDPEGAITAARELIETVLKHILEDRKIPYNESGIELPQLYKLVQKELRLAPEDHQEQIFKQILSGCSGVVNGLGAVRNRLGDAHGKGPRQVLPLPRHARLATNLAGTMALFLLETHLSRTE